MSTKSTSWKRLAYLKYVLGGLLVVVGAMGGLEALVRVWSFRGIPNLPILPIFYQLLWGIGNGLVLLIGILYIRQGKIIMKPVHQSDNLRFNKIKRRVTFLVIGVLVISLTILILTYLSEREYVEFLNRTRF